jgi:hypothetical protein
MKDIKSDMLLGFNHNIKHNGKIYHVQTEDSGVSNPHIITHLFVGGNIMATKKTSYADIVSAGNLHEIVKELMQEQHKAMLRNLVSGVYNGIDGKASAAAQAAQPTPRLTISPTTTTRPSIPAHAAPTQTNIPASPAVTPAAPATAAATPSQMKIQPESPFQAPVEDDVLDSQDLPPEVLAARRLSERPMPKDTSGPTIFGEDLISEKSLDEVILGYLSGEGEGGS